MNALVNIEKNPKVTRLKGKLIILSIGFIIVIMNASIIPPNRYVHIPPEIWTPPTKLGRIKSEPL
jgi:hypothetical protein